MQLKENVDVSAFLAVTEKCSGDVFFHTHEGDILNVKSLLSRYVVVSVCKPGELQKARIVCTDEEDYAVLSDFLQPDAED
ncbi:MAG: polya polymerase [Acetatifactor sp.]|nr:polya polymerase [Acetatifactor sp.]